MPTTISIVITGKEDVSDLLIHLDSYPPILIEENGNWVERSVNWSTNIEAGQMQTFTRNILLPGEEGFYSIISSAWINISSSNTHQVIARYKLSIHQLSEGGTVYYANTPVPHTPGPLRDMSPEELETLRAMPTWTPFPTFMLRPTITSTPTPLVYPPPATPPMDAPGEEPYP